MPLKFSPLLLGLVGLAVVSSFGLTALARRVAPGLGLVDKPDGGRKLHKQCTPLMGGVAIYLSLLFTFCVSEVLGLTTLLDDLEFQRLAPMLLLSGGLYCAVGLWDDKIAMRPRTKLLLQIACALPFVLWGRSIDVIHLFGNRIELGWFGVAFTIFWIVACTNVINLVDGLDGLAGTIGLIVCITAAVLSAMQDLTGASTIALLFSGCLLGFLLHNWPPAKIFLGDSGSLLIGFLIGALSIESSFKTATGFALAVPLVLISVPVFDTAMAILRRKLNGKGIGEADRGHIHHRLQDRGLSRVQVLAAISLMCMAMAAVTIVAAYLRNDLLALGVCVSLLVLMIVGRVFGYSETILLFRYAQAISQMLADTSGVLRTRFFLARVTSEMGPRPVEHWNELTARFRKMGGYQLDYVCWDERSETIHSRLHWARENDTPSGDTEWQLSYSVPCRPGERAALIASGRSRRKWRGPRVIDLFRVFDSFCRNWTGDEIAETADANAARILPMPPRPLPSSLQDDDRRVA